MILQSLEINNFGLYGGTHKFELSPDTVAGKPVVLIVGHNGSGKTTFLEAVRLALYGKRSLGPRVGEPEYKAYLQRRINNTATAQQASITLSFQSHHLGTCDEYVVKRDWLSADGEVTETLQFIRNGAAVDDIPKEDWNYYLEDLIPAGVSQLFFFDGEKIQDIADDQSDAGLTNAIKSLLGLDLLDQVRDDLALYKSRSTETLESPDLEVLKQGLEKAKTDLVISEEQAASFSTKRIQYARRSEIAQQLFQEEGGSVALSRETLSDELAVIDADLATLSSALKTLMNGVAVFALAPKSVLAFSVEVERVKHAQFDKAVARFVSTFIDSVSTGDPKNPELGLNPLWTLDHFETLQDFAKTSNPVKDLISISTDFDWTLETLSGIADQRVKIATLAAQLTVVQQKRILLRTQLKNFQPGAAVAAFDVLKKREQDLGAVDSECNRASTEAAKFRSLTERLAKQFDQARDRLFDLGRAQDRTDLATRAQDAFKAYEKRIVEQRLSSLSQHFVGAFNGLVSRKTLVHEVRIDPKTFNIGLFGKNAVEIRSSDLSAGERQLFAISMLWALGRTSGRELPMIIDTPLSRLDHAHRINLVSNYLPRASDQIIMLCTDTELTADLSALLDPFVNRRYEIGVVGEGQITDVSLKLPRHIPAAFTRLRDQDRHQIAEQSNAD